MPEAFKHRFSRELIETMADCLSQVSKDIPSSQSFVFDQRAFIYSASEDLDKLELKERSVQIERALSKYLPSDFEHALNLLRACLCPMKTPDRVSDSAEHQHLLKDWALMPVADFVASAFACFHLQNKVDKESRYFAESMSLLYEITQRFTSEFAIRHFIVIAQKDTLKLLHGWVDDKSEHVRRLVSEGTRPRLPWGIRLQAFVQDPQPILPLLEALKDDPSEYVRRSVANNLNDIAKDHPQVVTDLCKRWLVGASKNRQKLVRHACRTLLKQGKPEALALFGFEEPEIKDVNLTLSDKQIAQGNAIVLSLTLHSASTAHQNIMLDYVVYHQKANGSLIPKVFKWKSFKLHVNQTVCFTKPHSFKAVTTRKYYQGKHKISVLINGKEMAHECFKLI